MRIMDLNLSFFKIVDEEKFAKAVKKYSREHSKMKKIAEQDIVAEFGWLVSDAAEKIGLETNGWSVTLPKESKEYWDNETSVRFKDK